MLAWLYGSRLDLEYNTELSGTDLHPTPLPVCILLGLSLVYSISWGKIFQDLISLVTERPTSSNILLVSRESLIAN